MSDDTDIEVLSPAWAAPLGLGPVSYDVTVNGGAPTLGAVLPQFDKVAFAAGPAVAARPAVQAVRTEASQESVREIPLEIEVVIGRTKVSVAKLMAANEGDRFRLDRNFGEPVELQVMARFSATARLSPTITRTSSASGSVPSRRIFEGDCPQS